MLCVSFIYFITMGNLARAAEYYKSLPHQKEAFDSLEKTIDTTTIDQFLVLYRASPPVETLPEPVSPIAPTEETVKPRAVFEMAVTNTDEFLSGSLSIYDEKGGLVNTLKCTSSIAGRQYMGSWNRRGGLTPPTALHKKKGNKNSWVETNPIDLSYIPGVAGNFYKIMPFEQETDGVTRSDMGVHFDGNVRGSLGCLVCETRRGFGLFEGYAKRMKNLGFDRIELDVIYTVK